MSGRHAAVLVAVGGLALFGTGCYGDTDEATNVGAHSAQLNAHGKANNGPAYTYFEYWRADGYSFRLQTETRNWPAGAEGPFSERPQHLAEQSDYAYRVCGNDQGKDPVCASTKYFKTGRAVSTATADSDVSRFISEPGVNNNLTAASVLDVTASSIVERTEFREDLCGTGCGSHISAGVGCTDASGSGYSSTVCSGPLVSIKLGDLDDTASTPFSGLARVNGGPGNDSLTGGYFASTTLIGGPGRDTMTGGDSNDTIMARSATWGDADIDAISCGGGTYDVVWADPRDPISDGQNGCEHVFKP